MNLFTTSEKELQKTVKRVKVTYNDGHVRKFELFMWIINRDSIKLNLFNKGLIKVSPVYKFSKYINMMKKK